MHISSLNFFNFVGRTWHQVERCRKQPRCHGFLRYMVRTLQTNCTTIRYSFSGKFLSIIILSLMNISFIKYISLHKFHYFSGINRRCVPESGRWWIRRGSFNLQYWKYAYVCIHQKRQSGKYSIYSFWWNIS